MTDKIKDRQIADLAKQLYDKDVELTKCKQAKSATRSFVARLMAQCDNPDKDGLLSLLFSVGEAERIFAEWPDVSETPALSQEPTPALSNKPATRAMVKLAYRIVYGAAFMDDDVRTCLDFIAEWPDETPALPREPTPVSGTSPGTGKTGDRSTPN